MNYNKNVKGSFLKQKINSVKNNNLELTFQIYETKDSSLGKNKNMQRVSVHCGYMMIIQFFVH